MAFGQDGEPLYGRLQSDRPVQFKLNGAYVMPWGTQMGVNFVAFSGLLNTTSVTYKGVPVFVYGRGDIGRAPMFNQTDLNFTQSFSLPRNMRMNVQFNIDNLFDQMIVTGLSAAQYRDAIVLANDTQFFNGFNTPAVVASMASPARPDPRYKQASSWQGARSARLSVKLTF
jgi:hypothetical protein